MDGLSSVGHAPGHEALAPSRHRMARHALGDAFGKVDSGRGHHHRHRSAERSPSGPSQATEVSASWRRQDKSSLQIRTADGDVVRLRFKSVSTADFSSSARESGTGTSGEIQLATSQRTRISMSVRGELDADEVAAIQETIGRAGEIASDFFNGDVQAAFDSAADFGITSDEIASVRMRMKSSERFTYATHSTAHGPVAGRTATDPPAAATLPGLVESGAGAASRDIQPQRVAAENVTTPVADAASENAEPVPVEAEQPPAPVEAPVTPTRATTVGSLVDFLDGLLTRIGTDDANDTLSVGASFSRSISMSLKLRIVESVLVAAAESERPTEPLPDIVSDVIDDLVAHDQPPMDAVA